MAKKKMPPQLLEYFKKKQAKNDGKEDPKSEDKGSKDEKRKEAMSKAKKQKEKG